MDITLILDLAIKLLLALAAAFLIPWLRKRLGAEKLADTQAYIKIFVRAAEQLFTSADGETKKQWVLEQLSKKGIRVDLNALDAMIEAAVHELHQSLVQPQQGDSGKTGQ